jgi:hypothetical protein
MRGLREILSCGWLACSGSDGGVELHPATSRADSANRIILGYVNDMIALTAVSR